MNLLWGTHFDRPQDFLDFKTTPAAGKTKKGLILDGDFPPGPNHPVTAVGDGDTEVIFGRWILPGNVEVNSET